RRRLSDWMPNTTSGDTCQGDAKPRRCQTEMPNRAPPAILRATVGGAHDPRAPSAVLAVQDRGRHAQESHLLLGPRRGYGGERAGVGAAAQIPRGEGARWLRADDLRWLVERASLVASGGLEADRQPRRLRHPRVPRAGGRRA